MCGIVGYAFSRINGDHFNLIEATERIRHRGPDDFGIWNSFDGKVGFGHRRLSILDLTKNGQQPMLDAENKIVVVFNGEIYNFLDIKKQLLIEGYCFNSASDTEVIIYAYKHWGIDFLKRLNGMFSIAIYDLSNSKLILARDRVGEKPLFYNLTDNSIYFASELKALFVNKKLNRKLDFQSFNEYLKIGYVTSNKSILLGYNKLLPGNYLTFCTNSGNVEVKKYWELPNLLETYVSKDDLLFNLEELLTDSVKKQMVADVPVGVLLSGGLDSSIITALASKVSSKVKTFTVGFPGHAHFDEFNYAKKISNYFGTEHIELEASNPDLESLLPKLAEQFDEPISDSSMIPTFLVSQLVKEHCTVALGGDGGDELFGGYKDYNSLLRAESTFGNVPIFLRDKIRMLIENFIPLGFKGRNFLIQFCLDFHNIELRNSSLFDKKSRFEIISRIASDYSFPTLKDSKINFVFHYNNDLIQKLTRVDFLNYLPNDVLVKVDRSSMLNSLEIRAPFLDYRIIDFAFGNVPSKFKVDKDNRKILLRNLAYKLLPIDFDAKRKQGFSLPLNSLMKKDKNISFVKDVLLSEDSLVDQKISQALITGLFSSRSNSDRLFNLVMFELWRKKFNISI